MQSYTKEDSFSLVPVRSGIGCRERIAFDPVIVALKAKGRHSLAIGAAAFAVVDFQYT